MRVSEQPQLPPGALPNELFQMRSIATGNVIPVRSAQDADLLRAVEGMTQLLAKITAQANEMATEIQRLQVERDNLINQNLGIVSVMAAMQFEIERRTKTNTFLNGGGR
jgi:hypothetical protein